MLEHSTTPIEIPITFTLTIPSVVSDALEFVSKLIIILVVLSPFLFVIYRQIKGFLISAKATTKNEIDAIKTELKTCVTTSISSLQNQVKTNITEVFVPLSTGITNTMSQHIAPVARELNTACSAISRTANQVSNSVHSFTEKQESFASGWDNFCTKAKYVGALILGVKIASATFRLIGNEDFYGEANIRPTDSKLQKAAKIISSILNCVVGITVTVSGLVGLFGDLDMRTIKDFTFLGNSFSRKAKNYYDAEFNEIPKEKRRGFSYNYSNDTDPIGTSFGQSGEKEEIETKIRSFPLTAISATLFVPEEFNVDEIVSYDENLILTIYGAIKTSSPYEIVRFNIGEFIDVSVHMTREVREQFKEKEFMNKHKQMINTLLSNLPLIYVKDSNQYYIIPSSDEFLTVINKNTKEEQSVEYLFDKNKFYYGDKSSILYYSNRGEIRSMFRRKLNKVIKEERTKPQYFVVETEQGIVSFKYTESPLYYLRMLDDPSYLHPPSQFNQDLQEPVSMVAHAEAQEPRMKRFKQFFYTKKQQIKDTFAGVKDNITSGAKVFANKFYSKAPKYTPYAKPQHSPTFEPLGFEYDGITNIAQRINDTNKNSIKKSLKKEFSEFKHYSKYMWLIGGIVALALVSGGVYYYLPDEDEKKKPVKNLIEPEKLEIQLPKQKPQPVLVEVIPTPPVVTVQAIPTKPFVPKEKFSILNYFKRKDNSPVDDGGEKGDKRGKNKRGRGALKRKVNAANGKVNFKTNSGKKYTFNYRNMGSSEWSEVAYDKDNLDAAYQVKNALYNDYVSGRIDPSEYYNAAHWASEFIFQCEYNGIELFSDDEPDYYDKDTREYEEEENRIYEEYLDRMYGDEPENAKIPSKTLKYEKTGESALKLLHLYTPEAILKWFRLKDFDETEQQEIKDALEKQHQKDKLQLGECMSLYNALKDEVKQWSLKFSAQVDLTKAKINDEVRDNVMEHNVIEDEIDEIYDQLKNINDRLDMITRPEYIAHFGENAKLESSKQTRESKPKVQCPHCKIMIMEKNLQKHIRRQHENPKKDINEGETNKIDEALEKDIEEKRKIEKYALPQNGKGESADPNNPPISTELWDKRMIEVRYQEDNGQTIHWCWMHRHKNYCYINAHALTVSQDKLWVHFPSKKIPLNSFNAGIFCHVGDNIFFKVADQYDQLFKSVESMPRFRPKTKIEKYLFLTKRGPHYYQVPFNYVGEPEDIPGNPKGGDFVQYKALYSSENGDSGSIIYGWDSQTKQWHPFGVHYGNFEGNTYRKILAFWTLVETKNSTSLSN